MSNDSLNKLDLHEGKYHHAPCMYSIQCFHLKTRDNLTYQTRMSEGRWGAAIVWICYNQTK